MTKSFEEVPQTAPPDAEQFALDMAQQEFRMQQVMHALGITSLTLEGRVNEQQVAFQQNMEKLS